MKLRITLPAGVAVVAIGVAMVADAFVDVRTSGGPLAEEVPPNAVTFSVRPGVSFTYGGVQLHPDAAAGSLTLEQAQLEGATDGLRIVNAFVLPVAQTDGGLWFSYERFPPPRLPRASLRPLEGFTLGAGAVQVLLELGVHQAGTYEFSAVSVAYRAGGLRYRATYPFALRVCASSGMTRTCPPLELSSSALARGLPEVVVVGRRPGPRSIAVERARHGRPEQEEQCPDERCQRPPAHV